MSCVLHYVFTSSLLKQQVSPLFLICYVSPNFFNVCVGTRKYQPVAEKYIEILLTKIPDIQRKNHHSASRRKKSNYTPYMHCIIAPNYAWKLFKYAIGHGPTPQRRPCHKWAAPNPMHSHWHQTQHAAHWGGWKKGRNSSHLPAQRCQMADGINTLNVLWAYMHTEVFQKLLKGKSR